MSKYSDKIIVGGCSFKDKNYPSRAKPKPLNFKMWPEVIGELYDCEVINTAKCGFGNMAIYHETLDAIIKTALRIKEIRANDIRNANKDNINELVDMVSVNNVQYQINNSKNLPIKSNKIA